MQTDTNSIDVNEIYHYIVKWHTILRVFVFCNVTFLGSGKAAIMRWNIRPAKQQKFSWNCALDKPAAAALTLYIVLLIL